MEQQQYNNYKWGSRILYDNIEEVRTEKELSELLVNEYGIDKATADNDTREFLDYLENQGIIRFS